MTPPSQEYLFPNEKLYHTLDRGGLWSFVVANLFLIPATMFGLLCTSSCFLFMWEIGEQPFTCPSWVISCPVPEHITWIGANLGLVQGAVTNIYGIGLAAVTYAAYRFAEVSIWPILAQRSYTLNEMDTYVSAARGNIASVPKSLWKLRKGLPLVLGLCAAFVKIAMMSDAVIVGLAFHLQRIPIAFNSTQSTGGGIGIPLQLSPQGYRPAAAGSAMDVYMSWAYLLSPEPMPDQRDFVADRNMLSIVGDINIQTIRASKNISCSGRDLNITDIEDGDGSMINVQTSRRRLGNEWETAILRIVPYMTLWTDDMAFISPTRAVATIVFAVFNDTIEGGFLTAPTSQMLFQGYEHVSAVACTVDVSLFDGGFVVGSPENAPPPTMLSSLATIVNPSSHFTQFPQSDLALWLGAAITTFGYGISNAQPVFQLKPGYSLPMPVTTTSHLQVASNSWTIRNLTNFIEVGSGALAITLMQSWNQAPANTTSHFMMPTLSRTRALVLLGPVSLVLLLTTLLAILAVILHRKKSVPRMRLAQTSELILSTQSVEMEKAVSEVREGVVTEKQFCEMRVRYGILDNNCAGLGREGSVAPFSRGW